MPPKADTNRSGRETNDFPSVCENCLGSNPYVQMIKEEQGLECKICTRPFTVFRWSADRTSRMKKTNICLTCARLKNCCQCCMLDLSFGLPIAVRDAALKLVAQGPNSSINKEYYAQNHDGALQNGDIPEEYEKTDSAARDLLKRLAHSKPYYKRQRTDEEEVGESASDMQKRLGAGPGPIRTHRGGRGARGGRGGTRGGKRFPSANQLPPGPQDIMPPDDQSITSLFLTGVEDDLAEHHIRTFFSAFGQIRSIVCVHLKHCAFVNFGTRAGAEAASESCQGKAIIGGCPLRVQWGKSRPIGNDRSETVNLGGALSSAGNAAAIQQAAVADSAEARKRQAAAEAASLDAALAAKPPGEDDVQYPSQMSA